jgi:hypothetical protein
LFCVSYRKGRRLEYVVRDMFRRRGWFVVRAAASKPVDLVCLRKPDKSQMRIDDVVIYRCVAARGYGNRWPSEYPNRVGENSHVSHAFVSSPPWLVIQQQGVGVAPR